MDSARGVAAIVVWCRNSSCNSSWLAMVKEPLRSLCCFKCNRLFAKGCLKGCSKHVPSVVATALFCNLTPSRFHPFSKHPILFGGQNLQLPRPATEPRNSETPERCNFPEKWPKKSIKMSKTSIRMSKMGIWGILIGSWGHFSGGSKIAFFGL